MLTHLEEYDALQEEVRTLRELTANQQAELARERAYRLEAEDALAQLEEHFHLLIDNLVVGVVISVGTTPIFVNRAFLTIHGLSDRSQVYGGPLDRFTFADDKQLVRELALALQWGKAVPDVYEYRIARPDGEIRTLEASALAIAYRGEPASLTVLRDVTEHRRAVQVLQTAHDELERKVEERTAALSDLNALLQARILELQRTKDALQASEERLGRIVEAAAEAIIMVDTTGCITFANAASERIFHVPRSSLIGRMYNDPFWKVFTLEGEPIRDEIRTCRHVLRTGEPLLGQEYVLEREDGTRIVVSDTSAPLRQATGAVVGVVVLLRDISLQLELAQQSKIVALLDERQRIAMDLHDGVIQSLYALGLILDMQTLREPSAETRATLQRSVQQLNETIVQIRNYIFALRRSDLLESDLQDGLRRLVAESIAMTSVRPVLSLSGKTFGQLNGHDVAHVLHIAREALSNVIRHAGATTAHIRLEISNRRLILTIADDGAGFVPEEKRGGGEGLSNMYERAKALGGRLTIRSAPGKGTEVRVEVQVKRSA